MKESRPIIYRIPFSHYCQKAEWGLTQAGISYDCVDIPLTKMLRLAEVTATGLVPAMVANGRLLEGSDRILEWAADNAAPGTYPLYPTDCAKQVVKWETWAGDEVGPLARREAYRVAYNDPWHFTRNPAVRILAFAVRKLILGILKHYKVRRYEEADAKAVPKIFQKVAKQLAKNGTGYLLTNHATAADLATAALLRPFLYAAPGRKYGELEGWSEVCAFIHRIKPSKVLLGDKRRIADLDWERLTGLANQA